MTDLTQRRRYAHLWQAATVCALVAISVVLDRFPPEQYGFYPRCPFYELTGLLCPGCGGTRAVAALIHGHLGEAMHYNGLVVLLLPVVLGYFALAWRRTMEGRGWPRVPSSAMVAVLVVALIFGVVRNLV